MSMMVDGLAPRENFVRPVLQTKQPLVRRAAMSLSAGPSMLDLRAPRSLLQVAASEAVLPRPIIAALPIPARKPLSGLAWMVAGGATAAIVAGVAISTIKAINSPVRAQHVPAVAAVSAAAAAPATVSVQTPAPVVGVTSAQIKSLLDSFAANAGAPVYMVVKDLKTGRSSSVAADETITSASLYKLFVAHGIYSLIDTGKLNFSSPVPGTGSNVQDCMHAMITISDNTCGEAMEGMLGDGRYNATLAQYGFSHTQFNYPTVTSAGDVALLLERLYNSTLLSPTNTQAFTDLLKSQRINNRLPQGLPAGTTIAHKTGDVFSFVHDAGIVYGPKTDYLVVMMSGPWSSVGTAPSKFAELSSKLYALFNQ